LWCPQAFKREGCKLRESPTTLSFQLSHEKRKKKTNLFVPKINTSAVPFEDDDVRHHRVMPRQVWAIFPAGAASLSEVHSFAYCTLETVYGAKPIAKQTWKRSRIRIE
jgi:hypothetical protein